MGTHFVSVIHQDVKLMLAARPITTDYKDLIAKTVCCLESKACKLHQCKNCSGRKIDHFLEKSFEDHDPVNVIVFK